MDGRTEEREEAPPPKFTAPDAAVRRVFLSFFYGHQRLRIGLANALGGIARAYPNYTAKQRKADEEKFLEPARKHEGEFARVLKRLVEDMPIANWLVENVRGIAWGLAGQLVSIIGEISMFERVSNLWSYAGLKPGDRRRVGVKAGWNPELKRCLFNFAACAIKAGGFYAEGYAYFKEREQRRADALVMLLQGELVTSEAGRSIWAKIEAQGVVRAELMSQNQSAKERALAEGRTAPTAKLFSWDTWKELVIDAARFLGFKGELSGFPLEEAVYGWLAQRYQCVGVPAMTPVHRHNRAMRKIEKLLLQHLWVKWRELEGLPVTDPWVFTHGGHDRMHLIPPPGGKDAKFPKHLAA